MSQTYSQSAVSERKDEPQDGTVTRFSYVIGRTRFVVLLAVIAVMLVALSLFLLGAMQAVMGVWHAWSEVARGRYESTNLTVEFLEVVSVMLKAVVFYIIGVGLYSLFIAPLNLTVSLGVETLSDLESKVLSVVVVIMAVTFLEHFIRWEAPVETLQFGGALALVVVALVAFQMYSHRVKEDQRTHQPDVQVRAQREMFQANREEHSIKSDQLSGVNRDDGA